VFSASPRHACDRPAASMTVRSAEFSMAQR
jgi:hypothetical protein